MQTGAPVPRSQAPVYGQTEAITPRHSTQSRRELAGRNVLTQIPDFLSYTLATDTNITRQRLRYIQPDTKLYHSIRESIYQEQATAIKRPDYRTLQTLDAVIRERESERAAQRLCITQSVVSQRTKQLESMFGRPLSVRTVLPRPTEQGQKLLALSYQVELLEEERLGDEQAGSTPLLLSPVINANSLATWLLLALAPVLAGSPIRFDLQVEDETRIREHLHRGKMVDTISVRHRALPSCLIDKLGAFGYLFVSLKPFAEEYFPNDVARSALLKAPVVAFDHLDDMHQVFLQ